MKKNEKYNEILIAGIGRNPQLLTELLFYYAHPYYNQERFFDQIIVLCSDEDRIKIEQDILKPKMLKQMEKDISLNVNAINFTKKDIYVYQNNKKEAILDPRTTDEVYSSLEKIYTKMKEYTSDLNTRITLCPSGGRKSITSAITLTFQLLSRHQDEMVHLMVNNDIMNLSPEDKKKWFYPTDAKDPKQLIEVSEIPFLSLYDSLNIDKKKTFKDTVTQLKLQVKENRSISNLKINEKTFHHDDEKISLNSLDAAVLHYFINKRLESDCADDCKGCYSCFVDMDTIIKMNFSTILWSL
ncbi:CRISPR-associated ring nuclease [bacterium]|nr:CRISPR-associated ring nuclease [bacterium]